MGTSRFSMLLGGACALVLGTLFKFRILPFLKGDTILSSDTTITRFGLQIVNNSGATMDLLGFSCHSEQWRTGTSATANEVLSCEFRFNATDINDPGATFLPFSFMDLSVSAVFVALVLVATSAWDAEDKATEQENSLLTLVLKRSYPDGGYTVVSPEARFEVDEIEKTKKHIMLFLDGHGVAVAKLVDRLFERTRRRFDCRSSHRQRMVM